MRKRCDESCAKSYRRPASWSWYGQINKNTANNDSDREAIMVVGRRRSLHRLELSDVALTPDEVLRNP